MEPSQEDHAKLQQHLALLESIAKKKMSREAISRYGAVKMTHPETAVKAILMVAQAVEQGLKETITDAQFKNILLEVGKKK